MSKLFRIRSAIKNPDKNFDDLSILDVAEMIESDSSLSPHGGDNFDSAALDIFLHNAELNNPCLVKIRDDILSGIYKELPDSNIRDVDVDFLKSYANTLRERARLE